MDNSILRNGSRPIVAPAFNPKQITNPAARAAFSGSGGMGARGDEGGSDGITAAERQMISRRDDQMRQAQRAQEDQAKASAASHAEASRIALARRNNAFENYAKTIDRAADKDEFGNLTFVEPDEAWSKRKDQERTTKLAKVESDKAEARKKALRLEAEQAEWHAQKFPTLSDSDREKKSKALADQRLMLRNQLGVDPTAPETDVDAKRSEFPDAFAPLDAISSELSADDDNRRQRGEWETKARDAKGRLIGAIPDVSMSPLEVAEAAGAVDRDSQAIQAKAKALLDEETAAVAEYDQKLSVSQARIAELQQRGATMVEFSEVTRAAGLERVQAEADHLERLRDIAYRRQQINEESDLLELRRREVSQIGELLQSNSAADPATPSPATPTTTSDGATLAPRDIQPDGAEYETQGDTLVRKEGDAAVPVAKVQTNPETGAQAIIADTGAAVETVLRSPKRDIPVYLKESPTRKADAEIAAIERRAKVTTENFQTQLDSVARKHQTEVFTGAKTAEQAQAQMAQAQKGIEQAFQKEQSAMVADAVQATADFADGEISAQQFERVWRATGMEGSGVAAFKQMEAAAAKENAAYELVLEAQKAKGAPQPPKEGLPEQFKNPNEFIAAFMAWKADPAGAAIPPETRAAFEAYDADRADFDLSQRAILEEQGITGDAATALISRAAHEGFRQRVRTIGEALSTSSLWELIPYVAGIHEIGGIYPIADTAYRLEKGESVTDQEKEALEEWVVESQRDSTAAAKWFDIIKMLPAFVGEIATTGGLYTAGRKVTTKVAIEALERVAKRKAMSILKKKAGDSLGKRASRWAGRNLIAGAGAMGGTLARLPVAGLTRVPAGMLQDMATRGFDTGKLGMTMDDVGQFEILVNENMPGPDIVQSFAYSLGDNYAELLSEVSGGAFGRILGPMAPTALKGAVARAFKRVNAGVPIAKVRNIVRKAGWNGILAEMGEERIGEGIRAAMHGATGGYIGDEYKLPTLEQIGIELAAFAVPGAFIGAWSETRRVMAERPLKVEIATGQQRFDTLAQSNPDAIAAALSKTSQGGAIDAAHVTAGLDLVGGAMDRLPSVSQINRRITFAEEALADARASGNANHIITNQRILAKLHGMKADAAMSDIGAASSVAEGFAMMVDSVAQQGLSPVDAQIALAPVHAMQAAFRLGTGAKVSELPAVEQAALQIPLPSGTFPVDLTDPEKPVIADELRKMAVMTFGEELTGHFIRGTEAATRRRFGMEAEEPAAAETPAQTPPVGQGAQPAATPAPTNTPAQPPVATGTKAPEAKPGTITATARTQGGAEVSVTVPEGTKRQEIESALWKAAVNKTGDLSDFLDVASITMAKPKGGGKKPAATPAPAVPATPAATTAAPAAADSKKPPTSEITPQRAAKALKDRIEKARSSGVPVSVRGNLSGSASADGINLNFQSLAKEATEAGLTPETFDAWVARLFDEELKHVAIFRAIRALYKPAAGENLRAMEERVLRDVWASDFEKTPLGSVVTDLYGDTIQGDPIQGASEGLRMILQQLTSGEVTEEVKGWIANASEAAVDIIRRALEIIADLAPKISGGETISKDIIAEAQRLLAEMEAPRRKPARAKKGKAEPEAKPTNTAVGTEKTLTKPDDTFQEGINVVDGVRVRVEKGTFGWSFYEVDKGKPFPLSSSGYRSNTYPMGSFDTEQAPPTLKWYRSAAAENEKQNKDRIRGANKAPEKVEPDREITSRWIAWSGEAGLSEFTPPAKDEPGGNGILRVTPEQRKNWLKGVAKGLSYFEARANEIDPAHKAPEKIASYIKRLRPLFDEAGIVAPTTTAETPPLPPPAPTNTLPQPPRGIPVSVEEMEIVGKSAAKDGKTIADFVTGLMRQGYEEIRTDSATGLRTIFNPRLNIGLPESTMKNGAAIADFAEWKLTGKLPTRPADPPREFMPGSAIDTEQDQNWIAGVRWARSRFSNWKTATGADVPTEMLNEARKQIDADADADKPKKVAFWIGVADFATEQARLSKAEADLAAARNKVNTEPTEAQAEAGNYQKGHVTIHGLDITIENPKGSTRSGTDKSGKAWSVEMQNDYGYIKRTEGADGDHLDIFIGPDLASRKVFVVDQITQGSPSRFDEHKVMLGFNSVAEAEAAYSSNFTAGWRVGDITETDIDEFKGWLESAAKFKSSFRIWKRNRSGMAPAKPQETPPAADGRATLKALLDRYEEGDGIDTVRDLADEIDAADGIPADVIAAAATYREELREDTEELGGRGDADAYEAAFLDAIKAATQTGTPAPAPASKPAKAGKSEQQKTFEGFRRALRKAQKAQDWPGVIEQAKLFNAHYEANGPFPDAWADWDRAAEDAEFAMRRSTKQAPMADATPTAKRTPSAADKAVMNILDAILAGESTESGAAALLPEDQMFTRAIPRTARNALLDVMDGWIADGVDSADALASRLLGLGLHYLPFTDALYSAMRMERPELPTVPMVSWMEIYNGVSVDTGEETGDTEGDATLDQSRGNGGSDASNAPPAVDGEPADDSTGVGGGSDAGVGQPPRTGRPDAGHAGGSGRGGGRGGSDAGGDGSVAGGGRGNLGSDLQGDSGDVGPPAGANVQGDPTPVTPNYRRPEVGSPERNHRVSDADAIPSKSKDRIEANFAAIKLLRELEKSGRDATPEEKVILSKYSGWGSFKEAFNNVKHAQWDHAQGEIVRMTEMYGEDHPHIRRMVDSQEYRDLQSWAATYLPLYNRLKAELDDSEFRAMQKSITNAHFTSTEVIGAIWSMVRRLGFKGGSALEPAGGSGLFIGAQPEDLADATNWNAIELDEVTSRILAKTYPEARVNGETPSPSRVVSGMGFQDALIAPNSQDLVISNVPFHATGPGASVSEFGIGFNLHNYFFAKALEKVKPGGLVVFITSSSTMQNNVAQREWLAAHGDLVAAVRLPNSAFKDSAGTEVTTDIIVLRKPSSRKNQKFQSQRWVATNQVGDDLVTVQRKTDRRTGQTQSDHEFLKSIPAEWTWEDPAMQDAWTNWLRHRGKTGEAWDTLIETIREIFGVPEFNYRNPKEIPDRLTLRAPIMVNEYFAEHPEHVAGRHSLQGSMYGPNEYTVEATGDLASQLAAIVETLPENILLDDDVLALDQFEQNEIQSKDRSDKDGTFIERDGVIRWVDGAVTTPVEWEDEILFDLARKITRNKKEIMGVEDRKTLNTLEQDGDVVRTREWLNHWMAENLEESEFESILQKAADGKAKREALFRSWAKVRAITMEILNTEKQVGANDEDLAAMRARLNEAFDSHVAVHGHPGAGARNTHTFLSDDADYYLVASLEEEAVALVPDGKNKKGDPKLKKVFTYTKSPIFTRRVLPELVPPTSAADIKEAIGVSMGWNGYVSEGFIAKLLGVTRPEAATMLEESPLVFRNPETGKIETADTYLSGRVKQKLAAARAATATDRKFSKNVQALELAQPPRRDLSQISANFGARWIPGQVYETFFQEVLGVSAQVRYIKEANLWRVDSAGAGSPDFGTPHMSAPDIAEAILNQREISISIGHGKDRAYSPEASAEAKQMANTIARNFRDWAISTDATTVIGNTEKAVTEIIDQTFNDAVVSTVPPTFVGEWVTLPGQSGEIYLDTVPHRKAVIARMLTLGYGMMAHGVGSGKTYNLIGLAMELKRLGKANKPVILVQNSTVKQFAASFRKAYPTARVLVADGENFSSKKRARFLSRVATQEWDAVIMTHSNVAQIPHDQEAVRAYFDRQIEELDEALANMESGSNGANDLQTIRDNLVEKMRKWMADLASRQDNFLTWEQLNVDAILVDEAHEFKNAPIVTRMGRIKNVPNGDGSSRAIAMMMKTADIQRRNGGKGVFFATGTPVTNSMAEAFTMLKFIAPNVLRDAGILNFDDFAMTFGTMVTQPESTWKGEIEDVTRFAKFVNGLDLVNLIRSVFDVAIGNERLGLRVPRIKGDEPELVLVEATEPNEIFNFWLQETAKAWEAIPGKREAFQIDPWLQAVPIMLMQAGLVQAIDPRLINPNAPDSPDSKVNQVVRSVLELHEKGKENRTAQVIFSDLSNPIGIHFLREFNGDPFEEFGVDPTVAELSEEYVSLGTQGRKDAYGVSLKRRLDKAVSNGFNIWEDIKKKLVANGVPAKEIAIVDGSYDQKKLAPLLEKINSGEVRIVMGSTAKLGVGVNMQERLAALHDLSPPRDFKPAMQEQRHGRAIRQGNMLRDWQDLAFVGAVERVVGRTYDDVKEDGSVNVKKRFGKALEDARAWDEANPTEQSLVARAEDAWDEFLLVIRQYGLEKSMDSAIYGTMAVKQNFIAQLLSGELNESEFSDPGDEMANNMAMMAALAMGDPDLIRSVELKSIQNELEVSQRSWAQGRASLAQTLSTKENWARTYSKPEPYQRLTEDRDKFAGMMQKVMKTRRRAQKDAAGNSIRDEAGKLVMEEYEAAMPVIEFGDTVVDYGKGDSIIEPLTNWLRDVREALNERNERSPRYDFRESVKASITVNGVVVDISINASSSKDANIVGLIETRYATRSFTGPNGLVNGFWAISNEDYDGTMNQWRMAAESYRQEAAEVREKIKNYADWRRQGEMDALMVEMLSVNERLSRGALSPRASRYTRMVSLLYGEEFAAKLFAIDEPNIRRALLAPIPDMTPEQVSKIITRLRLNRTHDFDYGNVPEFVEFIRREAFANLTAHLEKQREEITNQAVAAANAAGSDSAGVAAFVNVLRTNDFSESDVRDLVMGRFGGNFSNLIPPLPQAPDTGTAIDGTPDPFALDGAAVLSESREKTRKMAKRAKILADLTEKPMDGKPVPVVVIVKPLGVEMGIGDDVEAWITTRGGTVERRWEGFTDTRRIAEHYRQFSNKPFFADLIKYWTGKKVMVLNVTVGENDIAAFRKELGSAKPEPGTIRDRLVGSRWQQLLEEQGSLDNGIHLSDSVSEGARETSVWFDPPKLKSSKPETLEAHRFLWDALTKIDPSAQFSGSLYNGLAIASKLDDLDYRVFAHEGETVDDVAERLRAVPGVFFDREGIDEATGARYLKFEYDWPGGKADIAVVPAREYIGKISNAILANFMPEAWIRQTAERKSAIYGEVVAANDFGKDSPERQSAKAKYEASKAESNISVRRYFGLAQKEAPWWKVPTKEELIPEVDGRWEHLEAADGVAYADAMRRVVDLIPEPFRNAFLNAVAKRAMIPIPENVRAEIERAKGRIEEQTAHVIDQYRDDYALEVAARKESFDAMQTVMADVARDTGAVSITAPIKKLKRILEKLILDGIDPEKIDVSKVNDYVRGSLVVRDISEIDAAAQKLMDHPLVEGVVKVKNRFASPIAGYYDAMLVVTMGGKPVEIQLHVAELILAKTFGTGHQIYEISRDLPLLEGTDAMEDAFRLNQVIGVELADLYGTAFDFVTAARLASDKKAAWEIPTVSASMYAMRGGVESNRSVLPSGMTAIGTPSLSANSVPPGKAIRSTGPVTSTRSIRGYYPKNSGKGQENSGTKSRASALSRAGEDFRRGRRPIEGKSAGVEWTFYPLDNAVVHGGTKLSAGARDAIENALLEEGWMPEDYHPAGSGRGNMVSRAVSIPDDPRDLAERAMATLVTAADGGSAATMQEARILFDELLLQVVEPEARAKIAWYIRALKAGNVRALKKKITQAEREILADVRAGKASMWRTNGRDAFQLLDYSHPATRGVESFAGSLPAQDAVSSRIAPLPTPEGSNPDDVAAIAAAMASLENTAPADEWLASLRQFAQQEEAGARTAGNPDIANAGNTAEGRRDFDAVRIGYEGILEFERQTHEQWIAEAESRLERDRAGTIRELLDVVTMQGGFSLPWQVKAAQMVINDIRSAAYATNDPALHRTADLISNGYMRSGSDQARAFAARHDAHKSPAERHLEMIGHIVAYLPDAQEKSLKRLPSPAEKRAQVAGLEAQITALRAAGGAAADQIRTLTAELGQAKKRLTSTEARAKMLAARQKKISDALLNSYGLTLTEIFNGEAVMHLRGSKVIQKVIERNFSSGEARAIRMVIDGDGSRAAGGATGLSREQVEAAYHRFLGLTRRRLTELVKQGVNLSSFSAGDIHEGVEAATASAAASLTDAQVSATVDAMMAAFDLPKTVRNSGRVKKIDSQGTGKTHKGKPRPRQRFDVSNRIQVQDLSRKVQAEVDANGLDMLYEYWINSILSGPQTQVVNIAGNAANLFFEMMLQKPIEAAWNSLTFGDKGGETFGSWRRSFSAFGGKNGISKVIGAAWRRGVEAFQTEQMYFETDYLNTPAELSAARGKMEGRKIAISGKKGRFFRIPGRALIFMDSFFKEIAGRMEVWSFAYKLGVKKGLSGAALESYIVSQLQPGSAAWLGAVRKAQELTFTNQLQSWDKGGGALESAAKWLMDLRNSKRGLGPFGSFVLGMFVPFIQTPFRIFQAGLRRTPLGLLGIASVYTRGLYRMKDGVPFHDSVSQARMVRDLADQTFSLALVGLLLAISEGDGDDDDDKLLLLTGTHPYKVEKGGERDANRRIDGGPLTLRVGTRENGARFDLSRIEPAATTLATITDFVRGLKRVNRGKPVGEEMKNLLHYGMAQASDKTFLKGLASLWQFMEQPEGPTGGVPKFLSSFVPNIVRQPVRNIDAFAREYRTAPWYYHFLPVGDFAEKKIDVFGEEVRKQDLPGGFDSLLRIFIDTAMEPRATIHPADRALRQFATDYPGEGGYFPSANTLDQFRNPLTGKMDQEMTKEEFALLGKVGGAAFSRDAAAALSPLDLARPGPATKEKIEKARSGPFSEARDRLFIGGTRPKIQPKPRTIAESFGME